MSKINIKNGLYKIDLSKVKGDLNKYKDGLIKHWEKEINIFQKNIDKEYEKINNLLK